LKACGLVLLKSRPLTFTLEERTRKLRDREGTYFGELGKNLDDTRETLRLYGNMKQRQTVLYVLEPLWDRDISKGSKGFSVEFWPWVFWPQNGYCSKW